MMKAWNNENCGATYEVVATSVISLKTVNKS